MQPTDIARDLVREFDDAGFTADSIAAHLGPDAVEALFRGEPGAVIEACDDSRLSGLIRFFLVREKMTAEELAEYLPARLVVSLIDAAVISPTPSGEVQIALDVRPHIIAGRDRFIFSDLDASMTDHVPGPDHVLGVGAASLSLLSATPLSPVETVLDLGTGSGVQALAQSGAAERVIGTDVHERALDLARATMAGAGADNVELRHGSWFEPVDDERFDRIVANPPFVVGLPEVGHVYRDSGLDLDGASELVVSGVPHHLAPNGSAFILGSWVHTSDQSWEQRVASWFPSTGVSAWVLQRDVVDPALYVSTWLKDESIDPRSADGIARTRRWLAHFREQDVRAVGFGWIFIRDIGDAPTEVTTETLSQPFTDPLGPEVEEYFVRMEWLRETSISDVLDARYALRPGVALENVSLADTETGMGFAPEVARVTRTDGPRFTHDVDDAVAAILAGLNPDGLPLRDIVSLWAASHGLDDNAESMLHDEAAGVIVDLIRHGIVLPAEIVTLKN
ncbi:class I SAM-dependent methyltransferase [Corynebacterium sp. P3-F1]|uniref:class I SAM-dependent methyltransferase n=1 Tax=Corynebacterium sp. P3-F1 TaxID=3059080 RepID=UPI00265D5779|nr:class I SAM-dependent methyltransferase [Corynebacterium sp. P3-F1]WKK61681.1 class I SAM-dependent methyltransferase [Corynebacterium sp. P3-F1]